MRKHQLPLTTHRPVRHGRYLPTGQYFRQVMGAILQPLRGSPAPRFTAKGDNGISTCVAPRVARPVVVRLAKNRVISDRARLLSKKLKGQVQVQVPGVSPGGGIALVTGSGILSNDGSSNSNSGSISGNDHRSDAIAAMINSL